jgi:hypothetical protein
MYCKICNNIMDITNNVSYGNTENISGGAINDIISSDDIDLESSETSSSGITSLTDNNIYDILNGSDFSIKIKNFNIDDLNKLSSFNKLNNNQKTLIINRILENIPKNLKINKVDNHKDSYFYCKSCGYNEIIPDKMFIFSRGDEKKDNLNYFRIKEYTKDPILPYTKNYNCINIECETHKDFNKKLAVFFRENLSYNTKYICTICDTNWNTFVEK